MDTINERIKYIRKDLKMSQKDFGEKIGLKPNSLSDIETEKNSVTEQTLKAVCREFNVSEQWLRKGKGEIYKFVQTDDYSEIATIIGEKDPKAKQAIIDYWKLSESDKELFWKFMKRFMGGIED
ncbi:MAG: helix-turn-helix transcriptional regulator [Lachnospira sp.]|nr:helix-turn-helix transcriptional regulator [Lachnospira sp.]